jgi:hypothetical protein
VHEDFSADLGSDPDNSNYEEAFSGIEGLVIRAIYHSVLYIDRYLFITESENDDDDENEDDDEDDGMGYSVSSFVNFK